MNKPSNIFEFISEVKNNQSSMKQPSSVKKLALCSTCALLHSRASQLLTRGCLKSLKVIGQILSVLFNKLEQGMPKGTVSQHLGLNEDLAATLETHPSFPLLLTPCSSWVTLKGRANELLSLSSMKVLNQRRTPCAWDIPLQHARLIHVKDGNTDFPPFYAG